ncbi:MAG: UDP-N-acetylmuramoyl-L-alanyl-D-glutamate--2,6-diaminopimelate ligase [Candidatus Omnitrophota bacterium]
MKVYMTLRQIFTHRTFSDRLMNLKVQGISDDSRLVRRGDMFFVIERNNFDILSVLKTIEYKVAVFVASRRHRAAIECLDIHVPVLFVEDAQEALYRAADAFYGFDPADFIFIGVTGTKGKTTIAYCVYHMLKQLGERVSLIGTVRYIIGNRSYAATHTTPDYLTLRKLCKESKDARCKYIIMEVSSHAIVQKRIQGIHFKACIFTNMSREHLDYHKTMKHYFEAKKQLFIDNSDACMTVNGDDAYGRKLLAQFKNASSYGIIHPAVYRARVPRVTKSGIAFDIMHGKEAFPINCSLLGRHNIYNILAATASVCALGFRLADVAEKLSSFCGVEGRLQEVVPDVFVDYAHTPDSLKKALDTLKDIGYKKVICVFGCGGNRDKGKRKIMGSVAASRADFTFITSDNPRNEDPREICHSIAKGFSNRNYAITVDRREALGKALSLKTKYIDCCVLVAGKGHEDYQIVGTKRIVFKDSNIICELAGATCL